MFLICSNISNLISCRKHILRKKKGEIVSPSHLNNRWFENILTPEIASSKLLYVGRIRVEKGIFSLMKILKNSKISLTIITSEKNIKIPLANQILSLQGTVMVFFGEDFITVKKEKNLKWEDLKHGIISEINHYYSDGNDVVIKKSFQQPEKHSESDQSNEIVNKINEILDAKIRPAVARDGGDITFKSFKDGLVTVELKGSCSGCPSSVMTLKQGVQNLLCHYIPEVKSVEAI